MADRSVKLTLDAKVDGLVNGLRTGKKAIGDFGRDLEGWRKKNEAHLDTIGDTAGKVGLAAAAGLTAVGKAAMDWESAWAGVTKTVDGTPQQMAKLEEELRGLAKTLPATHEEIAGVAEAAGQLGVARDDVTGFTRTMIDLSETTNLTADEAATNIAQISNVMGTMEREGSKGVERFGATLVALGNDGASTEKEIVDMAQRIAGAGATLGATEADVLALSNTLASMGVRAELGGGVATRVLLKMRTAVDEGGESLAVFAESAGLSADEFAKNFRESPVAALDLVSKGIGRVNEAGGNVTATMKDMGIKGTEETQVMLALASSGDLLTESLELGASAWEDNAALAAEAAKRYETTESKIQVAWNTIKDAAIDAGGVILPVVADIADGVADLAGWFGDLPGPVKQFATLLGGIAAVGGGSAWALINISKKAGELAEAFRGLQGDGSRAATAVSKVGKALGTGVTVAAGFLIAQGTIEAINEAARSGFPAVEDYFNLIATADVSDLKDALDLNLGQGNVFAGTQIKQVAREMGNLNLETAAFKQGLEALDIMSDGGPVGWFFENLAFQSRQFVDDGKKIETAMQGIAQAFEAGATDQATEFFSGIASEMQLTEDEMKTLVNSVPELKTALMKLATDNGIPIKDDLDLVNIALGKTKIAGPEAAGGAEAAAEGIQATEEAAAAAAEALDDMLDGLVATGQVALSEAAAHRDFEAAVDDARKALEENGKTLDINTDKGRANEQALDGIADSALGLMASQKEAGAGAAEMADSLERGRKAFIDQATAMGMPRKEAEKLADTYGLIPEDVWTTFYSNTDDLVGKIGLLHEQIQSTPDKTVTISDNTGEIKTAMETLGYVVTTLPNGQIKVSETGTDATGKKIDATAGKKRTSKINADAITQAAEKALNHTARPRSASISVNVARTETVTQKVKRELEPFSGSFFSNNGNATGGRIPRRSTGGRLPMTGLGTDKILGVAADGTPVSWVDDGEWVVNRRSSGKYDRLLQAINRDDPAVEGLAALASGGRVGWAEGERSKAKQSLSAAQREVKAAQVAVRSAGKSKSKADDKKADQRLTRAEKALDAAESRYRDAVDRVKDLKDTAFQLERDRRRGNITGDMSTVDQLFDWANDPNLSKGQRNNLRSTAYRMERELLSLEKRAESLAGQLEKATERRDELLSVRNSVASGLRGETSLEGLMSEHSATRYGRVGVRGLAQIGRQKVQKLRGFEQKLKALGRKGYAGAIVQEITEMGVDAGTEAADILLAGNNTDRDALNAVYRDLDTYSRWAGDRVTDALSGGMFKSGLYAADGLVRGLEKKQGAVDSAFYKLGKQAEGAFKRALGIKSPSRVMMAAAGDTADGFIIGLGRKRPDVDAAMANLVSVPQFSTSVGVPGRQNLPAISAAPVPAVYVQNPFTGEYLLAQVDGRADARLDQTARKVGARRR